jgi:hypothetical protein
MKPLIFLLTLFAVTAAAQNKPFSIQIGLLRADFAPSDVRIMQKIYETDVVLSNLKAKDNPYYHELDGPNWTILQYRFKLGWQFNRRWAAELTASHYHYEGITTANARLHGVWHGQPIDRTVYINDFVREYQHSHAVTVWNVGLNRFFPTLLHYRFIEVQPSLRAGLGGPVPNSNNQILNPTGQWEAVKNQYHLAGISSNLGAALRISLWNTLYLEPQTNVFGLFLWDVLISNGQARQNIWGVDWGIDMGFKFNF